MTPETVSKLETSVIRLEGKVDKLDAKVDSGDRQGQQLVELLKQQLHYLQASIDDLKTMVGDARHHTDTATSAVRVDLERQLNEHRVQNERDAADLGKRLDDARNDRAALFSRVDKLDGFASELRGRQQIIGVFGSAVAAGLVGMAFKVFGG